MSQNEPHNKKMPDQDEAETEPLANTSDASDLAENAPQESSQFTKSYQDMNSADPLLACLTFLSSHYGRAKSQDAIKAGLPYDEKGMGPDLFCEAASRMGMRAKIVKRKTLSKIPQAILPAVIILKNDQACVLLGLTDDKAHIYVPDTDSKQVVTFKELSRSYTGYSIFTHPNEEFSDPTLLMDDASDRHWFWSLVNKNKAIYARVLLAAVLINVFALAAPLFIMNVYDRVIPNNAIATGWALGIGALSVYAFDFIMRTLRGYFIDLSGRRIDVIASRRIYDQLLNMKLSGRPASSGSFASMLRDFESVRDFLTSATLTAFVDLPFSLLFIFIIYLLGGPIGLLLLFLILIVFGIGAFLQWPLRSVVKKSMQSAEAKHGLLVETIYGLETIKAISADGRMRAQYDVHVGNSAAHAQKSRFISAIGVNAATFVQQSATIIIVLMGMYLVQDSTLSMGGLIACVILGSRAISPIGQMANLVTRYHHAKSSLKLLNNFMKIPTERPSERQFLHRPVLRGKLAFESVGFTYPGTKQKVLDSVSFSITPGEKVGVIGRIGSGKSTIARLLMGLYDTEEGALYADDTDYRQIDPADLRRNIAYIAQDVVLLRGTVRENIIAGYPQATEEEILAASKFAGVHDFISRHPMGYDAPVGERGDGLSGGQRQAIALARAILLKPNIMICDEPTNAMDVQAEESFTKHIAEQVQDKTLILITHRQHLLKLVDRLILMDQGRVLIDGPRDKVIQALAKGEVKVPQ